jgi:hypothetical protein
MSQSRKKRDFAEVARDVVEQAIGEHLDGTPLEPPPHFRVISILVAEY